MADETTDALYSGWLVANAPPPPKKKKKKKNSQEPERGTCKGAGLKHKPIRLQGYTVRMHTPRFAVGCHSDQIVMLLKIVKGAPERKLASAKNHPPPTTTNLLRLLGLMPMLRNS